MHRAPLWLDADSGFLFFVYVWSKSANVELLTPDNRLIGWVLCVRVVIFVVFDTCYLRAVRYYERFAENDCVLDVHVLFGIL